MDGIRTCDDVWDRLEKLRAPGVYCQAVELAEDGRNQKEAMEGPTQPGDSGRD